MAIEAWSGGTPDQGFFLEVYLFIGIFGVGFTSGGPRVSDKAGARPRGLPHPPPLSLTRDSSGPTLLLRGTSSGP